MSVNPRSVTVNSGQTATFTAEPLGSPPFAYQWKSNNVNLAGQTSAPLHLANAQLAASGPDSVTLRNAFGSVSATGTLAVIAPPPGMAQILTYQPVAYWRLNDVSGPTI